jgi:hypothetical protein
MIPTVKTWIVRDTDTGETLEIEAPTKKLVKIIVGMDHVDWWFRNLTITVKPEKKN